MYLDQVKQNFIQQGTNMAAQINNGAEQEFLEAARNWAGNKERGTDVPPPVAPWAVEAQFTFDGYFGLKIVAVDRRVSNVDPASFLAKFGTDVDAVGGPIGGPIPDQPGHFYALSSSTPFVGQVEVINGATYVFTGESPWKRYWRKV